MRNMDGSRSVVLSFGQIKENLFIVSPWLRLNTMMKRHLWKRKLQFQRNRNPLCWERDMAAGTGC